jgi:UDP-N-acetylmuramyl pentapeptide phosphotransferase/UDP-N-acetylglucosamine-1-phosphate transferase
MTFPFNFFAAAFLGAGLTSLLALPLWRQWCLRIQLVDDPGHRKIHDAPVPLAGGLAVLTGILLPLAVGALLLELGWVKLSSAGLIVHGIDAARWNWPCWRGARWPSRCWAPWTTAMN